MTVESLMELPHKLMLGNVLLPDMEDDMGERREEKIWKCLTRRSLLNRYSQIATNVLSLLRAERKAMWNMAAQVEKKLSKSPKVHLFLKLSLFFLAKLVTPHTTLVNRSLGRSVEFQTSIASGLASLLIVICQKAQRF